MGEGRRELLDGAAEGFTVEHQEDRLGIPRSEVRSVQVNGQARKRSEPSGRLTRSSSSAGGEGETIWPRIAEWAERFRRRKGSLSLALRAV